MGSTWGTLLLLSAAGRLADDTGQGVSVTVEARKKMLAKQIVKGVIAVGGSDMVGAMLPLLNRCPGGSMKLVDQMMVIWTSRSKQIVLNEEALTRARKLGKNIAQSIQIPPDKVKYLAETERKNLEDYTRSDYDLTTQLTPIFEACPICHSDLVRLRGNTVECPMYYMKGTIEVKDGVARFICDPVNHPSPYAGPAGKKRHDDNGIRITDKLIREKAQIHEKVKRYSKGIPVVKPSA